MTSHRRLLYIPVLQIHTNRINSRGKLEAINQIEKWKDDGVVLINMSGVSFKEALAGNDSSRTRKAARLDAIESGGILPDWVGKD